MGSNRAPAAGLLMDEAYYAIRSKRRRWEVIGLGFMRLVRCEGLRNPSAPSVLKPSLTHFRSRGRFQVGQRS